jgi:hypothetical protein
MHRVGSVAFHSTIQPRLISARASVDPGTAGFVQIPRRSPAVAHPCSARSTQRRRVVVPTSRRRVGVGSAASRRRERTGEKAGSPVGNPAFRLTRGSRQAFRTFAAWSPFGPLVPTRPCRPRPALEALGLMACVANTSSPPSWMKPYPARRQPLTVPCAMTLPLIRGHASVKPRHHGEAPSEWDKQNAERIDTRAATL